MIRWVILSVFTIIILCVRTYNYGFFSGKDWFLYLILIISIGFTFYHRNNNSNQSR